MPASIELVVPADPQYVRVVRSVATGFAAQLDLPIDHVDDLRLAVSECCNRLLEIAAPSTTLGLRMDASASAVTMRVSLAATTSPWPPPDSHASLAYSVISSLADAVDERVDQGEPSIVTTWRLLASA